MLLKVKYVTIVLCLLILQLSVHGSAIIITPVVKQIQYTKQETKNNKINKRCAPYYGYYEVCIRNNGGYACDKYKNERSRRCNFGN